MRQPGASAAGGNSIEARSATSGAAGIVMNPREGRSRSKVTKRSSVRRPGREQHRDDSTGKGRQVERHQPERGCSADHFDEEDHGWDPVVRGNSGRLLGDHLVQAFHVLPGRRLGRLDRKRPARQLPESALEHRLGSDRTLRVGAPGYRA